MHSRQDSATVADALMSLFAMVGIPGEVLTDCGSNFTSRLMKSLYECLGVKGIKTSPYHPQTDGLVERFNATLKAIPDQIRQSMGQSSPYSLPTERCLKRAQVFLLLSSCTDDNLVDHWMY